MYYIIQIMFSNQYILSSVMEIIICTLRLLIDQKEAIAYNYSYAYSTGYRIK
jgi:hypothetical protein